MSFNHLEILNIKLTNPNLKFPKNLNPRSLTRTGPCLSLSPPHSVQPDVSHWAERSEDLELHIFCQNMASNATTKLVKLTSNVHTTYREKYHLDARRVTCYTAVSQADWSLPLRRLVISST